MLAYELDDAREHIESLIKEMAEADDFTDEDFAASLGHVFAHLNRSWNMRNISTTELNAEQMDVLSQFPTDLIPVG